MHLDGKILDWCRGALRFLGTRTTTFAGPDIDMGAVPSTPPTVVELLACGTR
jgi:hypothetical protein